MSTFPPHFTTVSAPPPPRGLPSHRSTPPRPSTRSANGLLVNMMMMSDENHRDIYISAVAMPPPRHCPGCRDMALAHPGEPPPCC